VLLHANGEREIVGPVVTHGLWWRLVLPLRNLKGFVTMEKIDEQKLFGASVKARRNQLGISQEALAGRANLHRTYVCDVERGARNVSLQTIQKLARALEISASALFSPSESQERSRPS
jgi:DNA-binding XRE family transcriptional regulator